MRRSRDLFQSSLFFTILFTLSIVLVLSWKLELYPFGDHYLRYMDGDQYFGFYGYLASTFYSSSNLLYSWSMSLGDGMLSTYAYYAASPFNLLLVFFKNNLILGMEVIAFLKAFFISISFCLLLNSFDQEHAIEKGLFSTAYAFIGYVVFYAWNLSWLDGVALLPLMLLGLKKLLYEKKKLLYILVIAIAIISNFYIGYMLCITSALFYLSYCIYMDSSDPISLERFKKSFPTYLISSLWGVAISLGLFLPTCLALPGNRRQSISDMWHKMKFNFKPLNFISMFYTGSVLPKDSSNNLPVIFIGIIPFILLFAYFLNRKIKSREKMMVLFLILIFICSFEISFLNIVWHGFSLNAWFNYRYSFIFSFILMLISFRSLLLLRQDRRALLLSEMLFLILTFITFYLDRLNRIHFDVRIILGDIFISLACTILLFFYCTRKNNTRILITYGICFLALINTGYNALFTMSPATTKTSAKDYFSQRQIMQSLQQNCPDKMITRIGNNNTWGRCEACQFNYAGTANYASTENMEKMKVIRKLGLAHRYLWSQYTMHAPRSTDDLIGFQYILSNYKTDSKEFELVGKQGDKFFYKNEDALPLIFSADHLIDENKDLNDFEYQNVMYDSFLPENTAGDMIFEPVEFDIEKDKSSHNISITVRHPGEGIIYIQLPIQEMNVNVHNASGDKKITYTTAQEIYRVGKPDPDGKLIVKLSAEHKINTKAIFLYKQKEDVVSDYVHQIKEAQNCEIKMISSSHLQMKSDDSSETLYTSTIPYDSSWVVSVDGERIRTQKNAGYFLSFILPEGRHVIDLTYRPRGFRTGLLISFLSLVLLAVSEFCIPCIIRRMSK